MGLFRFSKVSQVPGVGCQNFLSLEKGGIPCNWNGPISGVVLFWNGAIRGVALFKLIPELLLSGRIGIMGKVGIGGGGSSTMELTGVTLLRVLCVPSYRMDRGPCCSKSMGFCPLGADYPGGPIVCND